MHTIGILARFTCKAKRFCGHLLFAGVAFIATDASAQRLTANDDLNQLQEIVVTATKRDSTVHDTAISITAIDAQSISERGVVDFDTLAQSVPGLAFKSSGPGQTEFEMRGLASVGGSSAVVGFYLDDTPLTPSGGQFNGRVAIDPNLYDISRVEVLRGPQGTLYGSSSMGGTVRVISNAPDPSAFDASAQAVLSDTRGGGFNYAENAMLNLPLGDTAALRIVASQAYTSGWLDRIVIADGQFPLETNDLTTRGNVLGAPVGKIYGRANDEELTGARATLLWRPTDRLDITPMFFYQNIRQDGLNQIDSVPGTNAHYQPFDYKEGFADKIELGSLSVKFKFDGFDVISSTARWKRQETLLEDPNEELQWVLSSPAAILPYYVNQGGFGPLYPDVETDVTDQTSEELRVTSTGDSKFKWLAGYFYSDFDSTTDLALVWPGALSTFGTTNAFLQLQPIKIVQNSFFGELSYQITPKLKATAGARRYNFTSRLTNSQSGAISVTGSDNVLSTGSTERDQGASPKFDLSYTATDQLLLYATASRGVRPGGGNQVIPTSGVINCEPALQQTYHTTSFVASPLTFHPDNIWSYELGEKFEAVNHRVSVNAAEYFERWNGVQQNVPLSCGYAYASNAGDAHIYGIELEIEAILFTGLTLSANGSYSHGSFVSGTFGGLEVASGNQLQNIPEVTTSQSLSYRYPLTSDFNLIARVDNNYIGPRIDVSYGVNNLSSYDLTNARVGITGRGWSAMLFANNVANKRAIIDNVLQSNINVPMFNRSVVSQPLTFGINLTYHLKH